MPPVVLALTKQPIVASYDLSSVKDAICGAAPLSAELQQACSKLLRFTVRQAYGMTE